MSLYGLDASIRVEASHSRAIADIVEQEWPDAYPTSRSSAATSGRSDPGDGMGDRRFRLPHTRGVTYGFEQ